MLLFQARRRCLAEIVGGPLGVGAGFLVGERGLDDASSELPAAIDVRQPRLSFPGRLLLLGLWRFYQTLRQPFHTFLVRPCVACPGGQPPDQLMARRNDCPRAGLY